MDVLTNIHYSVILLSKCVTMRGTCTRHVDLTNNNNLLNSRSVSLSSFVIYSLESVRRKVVDVYGMISSVYFIPVAYSFYYRYSRSSLSATRLNATRIIGSVHVNINM